VEELASWKSTQNWKGLIIEACAFPDLALGPGLPQPLPVAAPLPLFIVRLWSSRTNLPFLESTWGLLKTALKAR
jgi:hypothetical protein